MKIEYINMARKCVAVAAFMALSVPYIGAQTVLDLEKCKQLALENNYTLKQGELEVEIARARSKEAFTHYFPVINSGMMLFKSNEPLISKSIELPVPQLPPLSFEMIKEGVVGSVMAVQPVFAGGQIVNSNRMAKLGRVMTEEKFELTKEEVLLKVEQMYWNSVEVEQKMKTVEAAKTQLVAVQKQTNDFVDAGLITKNNLLAVNLKLNELKSQEFQLENAQSIIKKMLAQLIGVGVDTVSFVSPTQWKEASPFSYKVDSYEAVQTSRSLSLLTKQVDLRNLERRIAIGKHLPSLSLGGAYLYHNLLDKSSNSAIGMVSLSIPISSWWGGSHKIKQARLKLRQAEIQRMDASQQLVLNVDNHYSKLEEAYKQLQVANEGIKEAEENYRMCKDNYDSGINSITELLDAQTILQKNENLKTDALISYQISLSHYLQLTNRYQ